jgi:uncharacterized protein (DUF697 family)
MNSGAITFSDLDPRKAVTAVTVIFVGLKPVKDWLDNVLNKFIRSVKPVAGDVTMVSWVGSPVMFRFALIKIFSMLTT